MKFFKKANEVEEEKKVPEAAVDGEENQNPNATEPEEEPKKKSSKPWGAIVAAAVGVGALITGLYCAFTSPKSYEGDSDEDADGDTDNIDEDVEDIDETESEDE